MKVRKHAVRTGAAALSVAAALATIGAGGASAVGPRQTGSNLWSSTKPGSATGNSFHFDFVNPENPNQKPHTVNRIVVHYPPGTVFDNDAAPKCTASDAQLQVQGGSACPAGSKVGSGLAVSDTGSSGPFPPRYTESTVSQYNGNNELIGVGENKDIPAIKTVTHTKFNGTTASTDFPVFPGFPPPDSGTPLKSLKVDFPKRVHNGHATVRTPPTCPSVRYWTIVTVFTYVDGVSEQVVTHSPCTPKKKPKPPKPPKPPHNCRDRDDDCDD